MAHIWQVQGRPQEARCAQAAALPRNSPGQLGKPRRAVSDLFTLTHACEGPWKLALMLYIHTCRARTRVHVYVYALPAATTITFELTCLAKSTKAPNTGPSSAAPSCSGLYTTAGEGFVSEFSDSFSRTAGHSPSKSNNANLDHSIMRALVANVCWPRTLDADTVG